MNKTMHQLWTEDTQKIRDEIKEIIKNKMKIVCNRRGVQNRRELTINKLATYNGKDVIVLDHPNKPSCSDEGCLFYYHIKGSPLRYFKCIKFKWVKKYLGLELPKEIFNLHHRKFSRLHTPKKSIATFSLRNRQRLYRGRIEDISNGGTRITGDIPAELLKGNILTPLTLSLFLEFSPNEEFQINIPQAEVVWAKYDSERTGDMGVKFEIPDKEETTMSIYMNMRSMEKSIKGNPDPKHNDILADLQV